MMVARRPRRAGFTLLEVLVAVAILGLSLTVILSAQVGMFASVGHGRNLGFAANLVRCKMAEVEVDLAKDGYPVIDQQEEGPCCEDDGDAEFNCSWKVELVELPDPPLAAEQDFLEMLGGEDGEGGPLGGIQQLQTNGAEALTGDSTVGGLANMFGESQEGGMSGGLATMAMQAVYPELQPMLEQSIRRVSVTAHWQEGKTQRELTVVQYVSNPTQGGMDLEAVEVDSSNPLGAFGSSTGASSSADSGKSGGSRSGGSSSPRKGE